MENQGRSPGHSRRKVTWAFVRGLQGPEAPTDVQSLGQSLQRVLAGQRGAEVLEGLPDELRALLELLLQRLTGK